MKKFLYGVMVLLIAVSLSACGGVGPVVKVLKEINSESARYWISFLKENGINAIDENGNTILLMAVQNGDPKFVEACLKSKAEVNTTSKYMKFPITYAVMMDNVEVADLLLKHKANPFPRPSENCLQIAITKKMDEMTDLILRYKPDLDYRKTDAYLFVEGTMPPSVTVLSKLHKAGYKPSPRDLNTYGIAYLYADKTEDQEAILNIIAACAKDKIYNELLPNSGDNVLTMLFSSIYAQQVGKLVPLLKVMMDAGIEIEPDRGGYSYAYNTIQEFVYYQQSNPDIGKLVEFLKSEGIDVGY